MADILPLLPTVTRAAEYVGGPTRLAEILGINRAALYNWNKRIPAERVLAIEAATNGRVTRHEMRPDIYPENTPSGEQRGAAE